MLECPYCQSALKEADPECPQCGIDSDKLTRMMGPMPVIFGGVSQGGTVLSSRDIKKLTKVIDAYQRRFPQSRLHLVLRRFPQKIDFKVILFWVFNQAGLSSPASTEGKNRDVVILIDRHRAKAGLIVGYGLEPLFSQADMDKIVSSGEKSLKKLNFTAAFIEMVETLTDRMREMSQELPEAVGLPIVDAVDEENDY